MKKALILSLGLAVIFGLTGCNKEQKDVTQNNDVVETPIVDEKPVMVLGGELPGDNAIEAAKNVTDLANDSMKDSIEELDESIK